MEEEEINKYVLCILLLFASAFWMGLIADSEPYVYEVKEGDTLGEIAVQFGDYEWWDDIYVANLNEIATPRFIYPGQKLTIPSHVVQQFQQSMSDDLDQVLAMTRQYSTADRKDEKKDRQLKKFRKAFKKVVSQQKRAESKKDREQTSNPEKNVGLGLGGMVLDETRTNMGSDFYSIFYKHWQSPSNADNFTITISEQPVPSMGTMVEVEIDNQIVFRNRLKPKYYKTEKAAKQAVRICQKRLAQLTTTKDEFAGY